MLATGNWQLGASCVCVTGCPLPGPPCWAVLLPHWGFGVGVPVMVSSHGDAHTLGGPGLSAGLQDVVASSPSLPPVPEPKGPKRGGPIPFQFMLGTEGLACVSDAVATLAGPLPVGPRRTRTRSQSDPAPSFLWASVSSPVKGEWD